MEEKFLKTFNNYRIVARIFILATLYYFSSKLAFLLAIPPGYASAIWPATGIATAFAYLYGPGVALGSLIGSFLINIDITLNYNNLLEVGPLSAPLFISFGAYTHAVFSAFLIKQFCKFPSFIEEPFKIMKFLIITGPISCLVSATIGVSTLYFFNVIPIESFATNWLTWWIGDSIGGVLITPLAILIIKRPTRIRTIIIPIVIVLTTVITTFFIISQKEEEKIEKEFNKESRYFAKQIEKSFENYIEIISNIQRLFESSQKVTLQEYKSFTKNLINREIGVLQLAWVPIVKKEEINDFKKDLQKNDGFKINFYEKNELGNYVPISKRDLYFPLTYVTSLESENYQLGYDLGSTPLFLKKMTDSINKNKTVLISNFLQKNSNEIIFELFVPIKHMNGNTIGLVKGVFDFSKLLIVLKEDMQKSGIELNLYKSFSDYKEQVQIYSSYDKENPKLPIYTKYMDLKLVDTNLRSLFFIDQSYLKVHKSWYTWTILAAGLFFVILFEIILLIILGQERQINRLVDQKTFELENALIEIKKLSKYKSDFLANMNHEIRTPMNGILGMSELILEGDNIDKDLRDNLEMIKDCSFSLMGIINNILDYTKLEQGKYQINEGVIDLHKVFRELETVYLLEAGKKNLNFKATFDSNVPYKIFTDELAIRQILINLLENAIKFTEKGMIEFHVSVSIAGNKPMIVFKISDTGIGIDKENELQLFESLYQGDLTSSKKYQGSGLGLSIVKEFIDKLDGTISIDSKTEQGTKFVVHIPINSKKSKKFIDDFIYSNENLNVLVVEDNEINSKMLRKLLEKNGHTCKVAFNGQEAIEMVRKFQFDLILMDLLMPVLDGYEATRQIRKMKSRSDLPIYAVTASAENDIKLACQECGMNGIITKPFNISEVVRILNSTKKAS
ncbi:MAG: response regulator [Halobacteriovoraceae bacterium]|nr:response regulator [Halobacteriovoraceae bacterium]